MCTQAEQLKKHSLNSLNTNYQCQEDYKFWRNTAEMTFASKQETQVPAELQASARLPSSSFILQFVGLQLLLPHEKHFSSRDTCFKLVSLSHYGVDKQDAFLVTTSTVIADSRELMICQEQNKKKSVTSLSHFLETLKPQ